MLFSMIILLTSDMSCLGKMFSWTDKSLAILLPG